MSRRIFFTDEALQDLASIAAYVAVESDSFEIARSLIDRLNAKCQRLADLPGILGAARPEFGHDLRSTPSGNYIIFFRYRDEAIEIIAVVQGSVDLAARFLAGEDEQ